MARGADDVLLGVVTGAHGLEGEVKVKTFTDAPESLGLYGPVTAADGRVLSVVGVRPAKGGEAIVRFKGIAGRTAAESLKGQKLFVPRSALPEPEEDEFYHVDLIGCAVEDRNGKSLGRVAAIHNFGAGDMLEIEDAGGETRFLPFNDDTVPTVDLKARRIVVEIPGEVEGEQR
jgi:16S rRNA processing protein RimM